MHEPFFVSADGFVAEKHALGDFLVCPALGNSAPDPSWSLHASFLRMIDFIAGMTDSYASEMAREMTGRSSPQ